MSVSRVRHDAWADAVVLGDRLRAFGATREEMLSMVAELGSCAYRAGLLGPGAPVLPSPDELTYAANVLTRVTTCLRHALMVSCQDAMAEQ